MMQKFCLAISINQKKLERINKYVEDKTKGKIPELIGHLNQSTVMVLVNYIYFKGKI